MSSANWFAKKLGTAPQPPPAAPPQSHREAPPQNPSPQPGAPQPVQQTPHDPENIKPGDPGSFTHALEQGRTSGGPAHKAGKVGNCPGCGSGNYLTLRNGPSCYDCGYPNLQGDEAVYAEPVTLDSGWSRLGEGGQQ